MTRAFELVIVSVVQVGGVRVLVRASIVLVAMAVFAEHWWSMHVVMMAVVVPMRVFVLERFMAVAMAVFFGQVQVHADGKAQRCQARPRADPAVAEQPSDSSAHERRDGEDRARASRAKRALRIEIEAKAQSVTGRSAQQ